MEGSLGAKGRKVSCAEGKERKAWVEGLACCRGGKVPV